MVIDHSNFHIEDLDLKLTLSWESLIFQNLPNLKKVDLKLSVVVWSIEIGQILNADKILKGWFTQRPGKTPLSQDITQLLGVTVTLSHSVLKVKIVKLTL